MLLAVLGLAISANSQTAQCKISGGTDGATVIASIIEVGDGYVLVELDNDGGFPVNVTVRVSAHKSSNGSGTRGAKVYPSSSTTVKVPVSAAKSTLSTDDYTVSVSGTRCN